ncbi:ribonuclease H-like domain-containing protein, partial [Tanacetum coccineum]
MSATEPIPPPSSLTSIHNPYNPRRTPAAIEKMLWKKMTLNASLSKLTARTNNEDIDDTRNLKLTPLTYANMALTGNGLDDFDWSNKADVAPVSLALMATNSESTTGRLHKVTGMEVYISKMDNKDLESQVTPTIIEKEVPVDTKQYFHKPVKECNDKSPKQTWKPKGNYLDSVNRGNGSYTLKQFEYGNPEEDLKDYAIIDSGCSGSMTGDKDKLSDFKEFKGGYVAFGNDSKGGRISGKGTIKTSCLDFEKVSYVEELKFNLLSVSQIYDKKHNVLFTDKECLILSPKFKFVDEDLVILRAPRKNDVYSLDLKNIIPSGGITCLVAKATEDEAVLWHRRLGHVNFKNINKLVKGNLVRGLPSKTFKLDHSCVACRKGKQHRASCKKIEERNTSKIELTTKISKHACLLVSYLKRNPR